MLEEGSFHKNFLTFFVDSEPLKFFLTVRTTISRYFSKILLLVCQKKIMTYFQIIQFFASTKGGIKRRDF